MKTNCDCGEPLDIFPGKGYTSYLCPKGHYESHESHTDHLNESDWMQDLVGWKAVDGPSPISRRGGSIADKKVREAIAWADKELTALRKNVPIADHLSGWLDAQLELEKLATNSGVLEIEDAIAKYKERVNAYLAKWRKKLQSKIPPTKSKSGLVTGGFSRK